MTQAVIENKGFQEKLMDKVQESIGDLLTKDDLKAIVEKGIEETFFAPAKEKDRYGSIVIRDYSLMQKVLEKEMKEQVIEQVKQWIKDNPDRIIGVYSSLLERDIQSLLFSSIGDVIKNNLVMMKNQLYTDINNMTGRL